MRVVNKTLLLSLTKDEIENLTKSVELMRTICITSGRKCEDCIFGNFCTGKENTYVCEDDAINYSTDNLIILFAKEFSCKILQDKKEEEKEDYE